MMELSYKIQQRQQIMLNTEMKLSIKILEMSMQDLHEYVKNELETNPLLEVAESIPSTQPDKNEILFSNPSSERRVSCIISKSSGNTYFNSCISRGYTGENLDYWNIISSEKNFSDLLHSQLGASSAESKIRNICAFLIDCLDDRGYLVIPLEEIEEEICCKHAEVCQALALLQSFQPSGVGARDLKECLLLQLAHEHPNDPHPARIVESCLDFLAKHRVDSIARKLNISRNDAEKACSIVRSLNPIPSNGYQTNNKPVYVIPDAIVEKDPNSEGFIIHMNPDYIPKLKISEMPYISEAQLSKEDLEYIREKKQRSNMLIRSIERRETTFSRVLAHIVSIQPKYFFKGSGLLPMTMSDLSEQLNLDVSTVSRATKDKYIICAAGTISLRSLFTSGFSGCGYSSSLIKEQIYMLISKEDKHAPLTDDVLAKEINASGMSVSRRAVAKYRSELGFLTSSERKR